MAHIGHKPPLRNDNGFTLVELLIVIVIIGVLAAVAVPMYTRHLTNAKAQEAVNGINAVIQYAKSYKRAHGDWPHPFLGRTSEPVPGESLFISTVDVTDGDWIDDIIGYSPVQEGKYFFFAYSYGGGGDPYVQAHGYYKNTLPFTMSDELGYNLRTKKWLAYGLLKDVKPE